jgi:hypothetical protein
MRYIVAFLICLTGYTLIYYGACLILPQFGAVYDGPTAADVYGGPV